MASTARSVARWMLGGGLVAAGIGHLTSRREEFQAQIPDWFPVDADLTVLLSGVVEIIFGLALMLVTWRRAMVGCVMAGFFVVVFPGNVAQWLEGTDAFELDTDTKRCVRLLLQPLLIAWGLWSTAA